MYRLFFTFCLILLFVSSPLMGDQNVDISLQKEIEHAVITGLSWLHAQQEDDGSWQHYPAITGLVLSAFMRSHPNISIEDSSIAAGYAFLEKSVQKDGGIYVDDMKTYNTSICLMAFEDARAMKYNELIHNARRFIMGQQYDEDMGQTPDSVFYGGVSYGGNEKNPDLSNLQWSLEALRQKTESTDRPLTPAEKEIRKQTASYFEKAIHFLQRTQNLKKYNDQPYSADDGGFMYRPGESKAGETRSYGGMTYAGMKSFIYAGVSRDDDRVQAAYNWIRDHYTVKENPGIGKQGLFYYYHTMAKALNAYGEEILTDNQNNNHRWRKELAEQLLKIQTPEGFWVNDNARWWENNPVLVTAYVVLTLEEIAGLPHSLSRTKMLIK